RAHVLARVAAEQPIADALAELLRDRPPVLDRQVRDATPRIQPARAHERARRACIQTQPAFAAALAHWLVQRELGAGHDRGEEDVRAEAGHDQTAVLADEADAGA